MPDSSFVDHAAHGALSLRMTFGGALLSSPTFSFCIDHFAFFIFFARTVRDAYPTTRVQSGKSIPARRDGSRPWTLSPSLSRGTKIPSDNAPKIAIMESPKRRRVL
jgi:hypothetical protein